MDALFLVLWINRFKLFSLEVNVFKFLEVNVFNLNYFHSIIIAYVTIFKAIVSLICGVKISRGGQH